MKCPHCEAENSDQSKFCGEYGSRLFPQGEVLFTKTMTLETGYKVLSKGKIFAGKYAISGEIGRGGMGVVYGAEDIIAFITDYAVVDRIIDHLKLTFVAERSPPPQLAYQERLMAAEASKDISLLYQQSNGWEIR
jgi:hypothetical protein